MTGRRVCAVGAAVVLALGVVACSGDGGGGGGEPELGEMRPVASGRDIVLPFAAYELSAQQKNAIVVAQHAVGRECMRRLGFDWPMPDEDAVNPDFLPQAGRYGLIDAAEAAQWGYHPKPDPSDPRSGGDEAANGSGGASGGNGDGGAAGNSGTSRPGTSQPGTSQVSQAAVAAWLGPDAGQGASAAPVDLPPGVPAGGCRGEAERTLQAGAPRPSDLEPDRLGHDLYVKAQADTRVQETWRVWQACMRRSGYEYADIWQANDDKRWSGPRPSDEEIAVAKADVACKFEADMPRVWLAVESAYQRQAIEDNADSFAELKRSIENEVRNAEEAVRGV